MEGKEKGRSSMQKKLSFDGFQLKIIAVVAMLCSHIYKCLLVSHREFLFLDMIGRISFPLFCFVLVEGYCHTGNRRKYLMRLWIGAVFSEIPFNLAFFGKIIAPQGQNVLFTMLIGMLALMAMEAFKGRWKLLAVIGAMAAAYLLRVDYGFYGILVIVTFYLLRGMKQELCYMQVGLCMIAVIQYGWIQLFALPALVLLALYNGGKGKGLKYFFYIFYPAHLLFLATVHSIVAAGK